MIFVTMFFAFYIFMSNTYFDSIGIFCFDLIWFACNCYELAPFLHITCWQNHITMKRLTTQMFQVQSTQGT